jgi:hypothetical protein
VLRGAAPGVMGRRVLRVLGVLGVLRVVMAGLVMMPLVGVLVLVPGVVPGLVTVLPVGALVMAGVRPVTVHARVTVRAQAAGHVQARLAAGEQG